MRSGLATDPFADRRILVLIASYRDTELAATVRSALTQAAYPEHVRFGICHQFDDRTADLLGPWDDDPRFRVDAVPFADSRGCCWARARTFDLFDDEPYILQIDAHSRFAARWDVRFVAMLESIDHPLPLLTTYPPSYRLTNGEVTYDLEAGVQRLVIKEVRADLTTLQATVPCSTAVPGHSPSIGAGLIFTRGRFCRDVPYDPDLYFAGEEISLAARAFTTGYELRYPNENLVWHLYDHDMPQHWTDHDETAVAHEVAVTRLRSLFSGQGDEVGRFGLGSVRSIADFESHAGISLTGRRGDGGLGEVTITIDRSVIEPRDDYSSFVIVLLDSKGDETERRTITAPDVLDLSRPTVTLYGVDRANASGHLVVPQRHDGSFGPIQVRR